MVRKGARFTLNGLRWKVAYVTPSRAHCITTSTKVVTVRDRTFTATVQRTVDISPNTPLELVQELAL